MTACRAKALNMPDRDDSPVRSPEELGRFLREHRKAMHIDQRELAGFAGAGVRFLSELERGKPTAQLGKVLAVLDALGLEIVIRPRRGRRDEPR